MMKDTKIAYLEKNTAFNGVSAGAIVFLEGLLEICGSMFGCPNYWKALLELSDMQESPM